jgi:hypothetical protein
MDEKRLALHPITRGPYGGRQPRPRGPRCAGEDWVDVCEDHRRHQAMGRPGAFTSVAVCPDCPDKPRPYACEGMLSVGQTAWPKTTTTSGTSGHVAEATWFKLSRLHNPLGQQGQWLCWYSTCFLRVRARSHGTLKFR